MNACNRSATFHCAWCSCSSRAPSSTCCSSGTTRAVIRVDNVTLVKNGPPKMAALWRFGSLIHAVAVVAAYVAKDVLDAAISAAITGAVFGWGWA